MRTCIYCNRQFDHTVGQGEHILPDGFGRFMCQPMYRGMCRDCNIATKDCDEELIRCSPAGLACFAAARSNRMQKRRDGGRTAMVPTNGIKSPQVQVWIDGKPRLAIPDPATRGRLDLPHQMRVTLVDGESPPIRLVPSITLTGMRDKLSKWQLSSIRRVDLYADQSAFDHYMSLLTQILPQHTSHKWPSLDVGVHTVRAEAMCMLSHRYFRAIAKTAFHYFLFASQRGLTGSESTFAPIRKFIRWGGNPAEFFTDYRFPATFDWCHDDGRPSLPDELQHILALDEQQHESHVLTWLGIGPAGRTPPHVVRVGRLPNLLIHPSGVRAHRYLYLPNAQTGYSGHFSEMPGTRLMQ